MSEKKINAESLSLGTLLRTLVGWVLMGGFHLVLGWGLHSLQLGLILAAWSLVVGPVLLPPLVWLWLRFVSKRLRPLTYGEEPELLREAFHGLLYQPGPKPELWVWQEPAGSVLWFEEIFIWKTSQKILLGSAWLKEPSGQKVREWQALWHEMAQQTMVRRKVRSVQIAMWMGALASLSVMAELLQLVFRFMGFVQVPPFQFLLMRFVWDLKIFWFGSKVEDFRRPQRVKLKSFHLPPQLKSLLVGPWAKISPHKVHPAWNPLFHKEALLDV